MLIVRGFEQLWLRGLFKPLNFWNYVQYSCSSIHQQLSLTQQTDVLIAFYSFQLPRIKKKILYPSTQKLLVQHWPKFIMPGVCETEFHLFQSLHWLDLQ